MRLFIFTDDFIRELEDAQWEFDSLKECRVDDVKRPKQYVDGDSWGISGTYRQTNIE